MQDSPRGRAQIFRGQTTALSSETAWDTIRRKSTASLGFVLQFSGHASSKVLGRRPPNPDNWQTYLAPHPSLPPQQPPRIQLYHWRPSRHPIARVQTASGLKSPECVHDTPQGLPQRRTFLCPFVIGRKTTAIDHSQIYLHLWAMNLSLSPQTTCVGALFLRVLKKTRPRFEDAN